MQIQAGSVTGYEHLRLLKNNQDAYHTGYTNDTIFGGVSDGISACPYSDFGSRLLVNIMQTRLLETNPHDWTDIQYYINYVAEKAVNYLEHVALALTTPATFKAFVWSHLQATYIGYIIYNKKLTIYGLGDGFYSVDNWYEELDSNNKPPCLALNLLGTEKIYFQIYAQYDLKDVRNHFSVASDGVSYWLDQQKTGLFPVEGEPIPEYLEALSNQADLANLLFRLNQPSNSKRPKILFDDTTAIWVNI